MYTVMVGKIIKIPRDKGLWLSSYVRQINFTAISLSLILNVTILCSNPRSFSSQSHAAT
jgi:hypothetical protein